MCSNGGCKKQVDTSEVLCDDCTINAVWNDCLIILNTYIRIHSVWYEVSILSLLSLLEGHLLLLLTMMLTLHLLHSQVYFQSHMLLVNHLYPITSISHSHLNRHFLMASRRTNGSSSLTPSVPIKATTVRPNNWPAKPELAGTLAATRASWSSWLNLFQQQSVAPLRCIEICSWMNPTLKTRLWNIPKDVKYNRIIQTLLLLNSVHKHHILPVRWWVFPEVFLPIRPVVN